MSIEINNEPAKPTPKKRGKVAPDTSTVLPSEGSLTKKIGVGDNAKNSIIWMTIIWSFIIGGITSLAIYGHPIYCKTEMQGNLIDDIKAAWSIFIPIITLALGYSFGKGN